MVSDTPHFPVNYLTACLRGRRCRGWGLPKVEGARYFTSPRYSLLSSVRSLLPIPDWAWKVASAGAINLFGCSRIQKLNIIWPRVDGIWMKAVDPLPPCRGSLFMGTDRCWCRKLDGKTLLIQPRLADTVILHRCWSSDSVIDRDVMLG